MQGPLHRGTLQAVRLERVTVKIRRKRADSTPRRLRNGRGCGTLRVPKGRKRGHRYERNDGSEPRSLWTVFEPAAPGEGLDPERPCRAALCLRQGGQQVGAGSFPKLKIPHQSHADFCSTDTAGGLDNKKRRYAPRGGVAYRLFLWGFPKGATPHLAHDFAKQSVVCYTLCRRCRENAVAAGEGKGI